MTEGAARPPEAHQDVHLQPGVPLRQPGHSLLRHGDQFPLSRDQGVLQHLLHGRPVPDVD